MIKKVLFLTLFVMTAVQAKTINIAVAANVSYAMNALITQFNKTYPQTKIRVTLGSSGKLFAQIQNGAPYDLFMSANMKYPTKLFESKHAIAQPTIYAQGSLAMLSAKPRAFSKGIALLLDKDIKKIAIANPKTAPYGIASFEALNKVGLLDTIIPKLVFGESISQTISFTLIASDIGLVAKSSLYSPKMSHFKEHINYKELDASLYTPIKQGVVILKQAQKSAEVKAFFDFLLSQEAKTIFKSYGYIIHE